jgi:hypothetical protein
MLKLEKTGKLKGLYFLTPNSCSHPNRVTIEKKHSTKCHNLSTKSLRRDSLINGIQTIIFQMSRKVSLHDNLNRLIVRLRQSKDNMLLNS